MKLILIRHGLSEGNIINRHALERDDRFYTGQLDVALSEQGRRDAEALKTDPRILSADAFFASDLSRTRETAACLTNRPVIFDARLRERGMGELEGHFRSELQEDPRYEKYFTDPDFMRFQNDFVTRSPGGENYTDVSERVISFLRDLGSKNYDRVVIVSHYCTIRCFLHLLAGLSREETITYSVKNCAPLEVDFHPDEKLVI